MGHFTTNFCTRTDSVVFQFAPSECRRHPKSIIVNRSIPALLSAYQEYPVTFKLMTSQVVQRARPLTTRICALASQRVKTLATELSETFPSGGTICSAGETETTGV